MLNRLTLQYIAAFLAAPLFVSFYIFFFQYQTIDIDLLFDEPLKLLFFLLFYSVFEELIFRGLIQEYIALKTKHTELCCHITVANVLTSLFFVSIHFIYHTPLWAMLVLMPSLVFGYFKEQYGSIIPSILLHIFYNLCALFIVI